MKLTPEQIDHLYQFTRQHYVEYYDLQTELVDHLANAIEAQWKENPKVDFETALQIEFKKFGIFGFTDVVAQRKMELEKKYKALVWKHIKAFYTIPKIIGTLISIGVVFKFLKSANNFDGLIGSLFFVLFSMLCVGVVIRVQIQRSKNKKTGKKWLFNRMLAGFSMPFSYGYSLFVVGLQFSTIYQHDWLLWIASIMLVSFVLLLYVVLFLIPSKAEEYLKQTYPEYELAKNP